MYTSLKLCWLTYFYSTCVMEHWYPMLRKDCRAKKCRSHWIIQYAYICVYLQTKEIFLNYKLAILALLQIQLMITIAVPSMISKQTSMAARAPMLRRSICSSCMSSQLAPEKPVVQAHLYRSFVSRLTQVPPLRQGLSRHSLRSSHPFPSGVTRWPRGHLNPTKPG